MPTTKPKLEFTELKKKWHRFPETKSEKVARKQAESLALEYAEKRQNGVFSHRTVERDLLSTTPIGGRKGHIYGRKKSQDPDKVCVYLLRFISIRKPYYKFLKIGITNVRIGTRFAEDCYRYKLTPLGVLRGLKRNDALKIEKRLHSMFADAKHEPDPGLLSGGNTECFYDEEGIVRTTLRIFALFNIELERIKAGLVQ
jgi:hypothetical protein